MNGVENDGRYLKLIIHDRRRGHYGPATEEDLARYRDFAQRWESLIEEGALAGFLDCGEIVNDSEVRGQWVWDESEDDYQERLATTRPVIHWYGSEPPTEADGVAEGDQFTHMPQESIDHMLGAERNFSAK